MIAVFFSAAILLITETNFSIFSSSSPMVGSSKRSLTCTTFPLCIANWISVHRGNCRSSARRQKSVAMILVLVGRGASSRSVVVGERCCPRADEHCVGRFAPESSRNTAGRTGYAFSDTRPVRSDVLRESIGAAIQSVFRVLRPRLRFACVQIQVRWP